jgi:hypothetical protein
MSKIYWPRNMIHVLFILDKADYFINIKPSWDAASDSTRPCFGSRPDLGTFAVGSALHLVPDTVAVACC